MLVNRDGLTRNMQCSKYHVSAGQNVSWASRHTVGVSDTVTGNVFLIAATTDRPKEPPVGVPVVYIVVSACIIVVIISILIAVLVNATRKRARGTTWLPEGFAFRSGSAPTTGIGAKPKHRRGPDGQEMRCVKLKKKNAKLPTDSGAVSRSENASEF